mmetsp:Transcript_10742/g.23626  ORF Transcript_10742/g.23626 Transcript_10742/m.23626 type:complete len:272 (-) Transcript_10742:308-1123(-)
MPIPHLCSLHTKIIPNRQSTHDNLVLWHFPPLHGQLLNSLACHKELFHPIGKPHGMSASQVSTHCEYGEVSSRLLAQIAARQDRHVRHERVDTHDYVGVVLLDPLPNGTFHSTLHVNIGHHFVRPRIAHVVDQLPLLRMRTQMLVHLHQRVVGRRAVQLHNVAEGVDRSREEEGELLCEGGGGGAVAASGVGREEEDFECARVDGRVGDLEGRMGIVRCRSGRCCCRCLVVGMFIATFRLGCCVVNVGSFLCAAMDRIRFRPLRLRGQFVH